MAESLSFSVSSAMTSSSCDKSVGGSRASKVSVLRGDEVEALGAPVARKGESTEDCGAAALEFW